MMKCEKNSHSALWPLEIGISQILLIFSIFFKNSKISQFLALLCPPIRLV